MKWLSEKIDLVKLQIDYEFLKIKYIKNNNNKRIKNKLN
jgi:hypothetical protein